MDRNNQHVVPHGDGQWAVMGEGNERATHVVETQDEAIELAREIATNQEAEVVVHGEDGEIRAKYSYGNDPRDIEG